MQFISRAAALSTWCLLSLALPRADTRGVGAQPAALAARGQPQCAAAAQLTQDAVEEVQAALQERQVAGAFDRWRTFTGTLLDSSTGDKRWSDKTGNCRLPVVDSMLRDPLDAIVQAETLTRQIHAAASRADGLAELSQLARHLTNVTPAQNAGLPEARPAPPFSEQAPTDLMEPASSGRPLPRELAEVEAVLLRAREHLGRALESLSPAEAQSLANRIPGVTTSPDRSGAFWNDIAGGRELADELERVDRDALFRAGEELGRLTQPELSDGAFELASSHPQVQRISTAAGVILLGTRGDDTFDLTDVSIAGVIDPGGNDVYLEGAVGPVRPVLVILDAGGDDTYRGVQPAIQGSAILGVSLLVDRAGNDHYEGGDIAQGACVAGIGMLLDHDGNDTYVGRQRVQASAICGLALLVDRGGNDRYKAARSAQAFGGPLGLGVLDDLKGDDHYYAGGLFADSYGDTPGYDAWSQGVGSGPRGSANGGIGALLDGAGNDEYEFDYFSHGAGYWFAAGFARDFGGNDIRHGATRADYYGRPRAADATRDGVEQRFLRWGIGVGCHYGIGCVLDDGGDDTYGGDIVGTGVAWDIGIGAVLDFGGNDTYAASGGMQQGVAAEVGLAMLFDASGNDAYLAPGAGTASPNVTYHAMPQAGGNFSYVIDLAGQDKLPEQLRNGHVHERGSPQGWIVDR